jgi:acyl carrier protein
MELSEIIKTTKSFLADEFEIDEEKIQPSANLRETLDLDSLDYVDLVVIIETNFGFKVKAEDFTDIKTFQDFYNYIFAKVNTK